jgi:diphthine-ammonia ligase
MKVVALISGGKDSCFNMMHCVANGHEIVALANLYPEEKDELDSYMFQTVGHETIELYAQCMELPLFRQAIRGRSIDTSETYSITPEDEVEDLLALLQRAKAEIPEIEAVSTGAILSSYQRVRVENVCRRLGLVSLAYLWQKDQSELLNSMIQFGLHAVVIKVAAIGLTEKHLGKSLEELQHHLEAMRVKYGINVCGEGGEYETLTLCSPLFRKRIEINESAIKVHSDDMFAPVAYLKIKSTKLVDNPLYNLNWRSSLRLQSVRPCLEYTNWNLSESTLATESPFCLQSHISPQMNVVDSSYYFIMPLTCIPGDGLEGTTYQTLNYFKKKLLEVGLSMNHVVLMTVYVKDMSKFTCLNNVYSQFFGNNPSTRVTVQLDIEHDVMMECIAFKDLSLEREHTLHVQSYSYWAPANIGPYSQAVRVNDLIFMAGMIGFDPSSMMLKQGDNELHTFQLQTLQCIQNCNEVARCMEADLLKDTLSCICYVVKSSQLDLIRKLLNDMFPNIASIVVQVPRLPRDALVEFHFMLGDSKSIAQGIEGRQRSYHRQYNIDIVEYGSSSIQSLFLNDCDYSQELGPQIYSRIMECRRANDCLLARIFIPSGHSSEALRAYLSQKMTCAITIVPVRNQKEIQILTFSQTN